MKKRNMIYFGAVVLCISMLTASASAFPTTNVEIEKNLKIETRDSTPIAESSEVTGTIEPIIIENYNPIRSDTQVTDAVEDELNPAIGVDPQSEYLLAYTFEESASSNIIPWRFSVDGGVTWDPGLYYNIIGTESHPAISYSGVDKKFAGTIEGDPFEGNGAIQYTFTCEDPTILETYNMFHIDWSARYPYYDRYTPDVSGYVLPDIPWWYGMIAVVGTRDSPGSPDMPIFNYANYEEEGRGWSSYFSSYSGCEHVSIDVDLTNGYFYAVFDYLDTTDWDLLVKRGDCHGDGGTPNQHPIWFSDKILGDAENTKYPAVGAHGDYVIALAQSDEAGTEDIVCYYSGNAGESWQKSYVANDALSDELYPTIVSYGLLATCTFIMDGDLYYSKTTDGGATWDTPTKLNDVDGTVESDFRNVDITTDGTVIWTDNQNTNLDLYFDNVGAPQPPGAPVIDGPTTGGAGAELTFEFTATDPQGGDIAEYIVDWGDGNQETIIGPFASGSPATSSHIWDEEGDYVIRAKAKSIYGFIGPEGTLSISIPRDKAVQYPLLLRLFERFPNAFLLLRALLEI